MKNTSIFYVNSPTVSTYTAEYAALRVSDDRAEHLEESGSRTRSARGAIIGILLGASCWGVILVFATLIKF